MDWSSKKENPELGKLPFVNFFFPVTHATRLLVWDNSHDLVHRENELHVGGETEVEWDTNDKNKLTWAQEKKTRQSSTLHH